MISELFLSCALALPPAVLHFRGWDAVSSRQFVEEYKELKTFLNKFGPGQEFYVMPKRLHAVPDGYHVLPFMFKGHKIYQRSA